MEITQNLAADHHGARSDIALNPTFCRQNQIACACRISLDIANDLAIDAQTTAKHQLALDAATLPDPGFNAVLPIPTPLFPLHRHLE
jgi:hypothetical protein